MIKAVFIDYTGTTVYQTGNEMDEIVSLVKHHSDFESDKDILKFFYKTRVEREESYYLDTYKTEDEIIDEQLEILSKEHKFTLKHNVIKDLVHQFWENTPVYEDAVEFFKYCPLPIYVLTNNGKEFVEKTLNHHSLKCTEIISSDDVKAYKPKKELFEKALSVANVKPEEVIHIGDSWSNDVLGAQNSKIEAIWLMRNKETPKEGVLCIKSLIECLKILKQ